MSVNYLRWNASIWGAETDFLDTDYDADGQILRSKLVAVAPAVTLYVSAINYQFTPTHELAVDIGGRPYSRNRGFTDSWNLVSTPYYFDPDGTQYADITNNSFLMSVISRRHLWIAFDGQGLNNRTTGIANPLTLAVKVAFVGTSETINNASATRIRNIQFQRKFRTD